MMKTLVVMGVDIGGSHITSALVDLKTKKMLPASEFRQHVNANETADDIIAKWAGAICNSFDTITVTDKKIGIAMPGPFDYNTGIALMKGQDKFDNLYGLNVKEMLANSLDIDAANILLVNDAECFLRGEVFCGAARDFNKSIGLTLGTGLGSSVCDHGIVRDADLWRSLFKDGIAEDYLSTRWFINQYKVLTGQQARNVKDIVDRSASDPAAKQIFYEFGKNLALFLNDFIWKNKPEAVVIGGNISNAWDLFSVSLNQHLSTVPFNVIIRKAMLGEEAQLIGAASCWYKNEPRILAA